MNDGLKVVHESVVNFDRDLPQFGTNGGVHQKGLEATSPVQMWLVAIDMILRKLSDDSVPLSSVKSISGTGQQHGSVYWKDGARNVLKCLDPLKTVEAQLKVCIHASS